MKAKFSIIKFLHTWHRRLGLVAFLLIMIVSITGLMLNHTEYFKLDEASVQNSYLLKRYGLKPKGDPISFKVQSFTVTQWEQQLFVDNVLLQKHPDKLVGVAQIDDAVLVALINNLILLDSHGETIEEMASPLNNIELLGVLSKQFVIRANQRVLKADDAVIEWQEINPKGIEWSVQTALLEQQKRQLENQFKGQGLNLERVTLDLHSGRLFNDAWGVYIMDGAAIILIMLGMSGFGVWFKRFLRKS